MKTCTEKERENCNCEKLGCKGCYYNKDIKEQIKEDTKELKNK